MIITKLFVIQMTDKIRIQIMKRSYSETEEHSRKHMKPLKQPKIHLPPFDFLPSTYTFKVL